jgi:hypothetical protein
MKTLEETLRHSHDWAVDRIHHLSENKNYDDAYSIQQEFKEWFDSTIEDHDIFSIQELEQ